MGGLLETFPENKAGLFEVTIVGGEFETGSDDLRGAWEGGELGRL